MRLKYGWRVVMLQDFKRELGDLNPNYYGMVDQIVCSQGGEVGGGLLVDFFGLHPSTAGLPRARGRKVLSHAGQAHGFATTTSVRSRLDARLARRVDGRRPRGAHLALVRRGVTSIICCVLSCYMNHITTKLAPPPLRRRDRPGRACAGNTVARAHP